jgi:hypothetical protein
VGAAAVGGRAAELRGAEAVERPRAEAGVGGALRGEEPCVVVGEENKGEEELRRRGGVRPGELRAQLRRRSVEGRGGPVLARRGRPRRQCR